MMILAFAFRVQKILLTLESGNIFPVAKVTPHNIGIGTAKDTAKGTAKSTI